MPNLTAFLTAAGWQDAARTPLAGDASTRSYARLRHPDGRQAILMQAPPLPDDSTRRFVAVDEILSNWGLSAPRILSGAPDDGLLLLEDLGDAVFAPVIKGAPSLEPLLYGAATDLLAVLHRHTAPASLAHPNAEVLAAMTEPAVTWYAGPTKVRQKSDESPNAFSALSAALLPLLQAHAIPARPVLVHRDFHAENLIWLPNRTGPARTGLLDFQDAFAGHPAYDLASLLDDARRDLGEGIRATVIEHYLTLTGLPEAPFRAALATLGAQRNLRILGIFSRLSLHFGKPRYIALIPRVWGHLQANLAHPDLTDLADCVARYLPEPTPDLLQGLTDRCGTIPTP
ncbi:aminoglycoside phosphotransferase family protein [Pseudoruegeria sp. SK021]|uniref:aminoglycoside phosphotransferase family protein n=1 Tax=Pseudoruegeria sp. SK021 TaxID=1933035 RepID=UPI000A24AAF8|nr:phosphotransferase [Pseudoruegeria sp. SK021]OSP55357.1 hypothetical protein BV911_07935 [Pseudoruegeria sp. SK021]